VDLVQASVACQKLNILHIGFEKLGRNIDRHKLDLFRAKRTKRVV
jgi:hypothetical protein